MFTPCRKDTLTLEERGHVSDDGRGPDLHLSQSGVCFQGQRPRTRCQEELQFAGEKGKASCVSWEERNLVLMGGLTLGSLVLRSSSGRLSVSVSIA